MKKCNKKQGRAEIVFSKSKKSPVLPVKKRERDAGKKGRAKGVRRGGGYGRANGKIKWGG